MTARPARSRPPRTPRLTAAAVAGAGMVNLISVAVPVERARLHLLATYVPGVLVTTATAATAASGVGLLLLAGGLRRRRRSPPASSSRPTPEAAVAAVAVVTSTPGT